MTNPTEDAADDLVLVTLKLAKARGKTIRVPMPWEVANAIEQQGGAFAVSAEYRLHTAGGGEYPAVVEDRDWYVVESIEAVED